MEQKKTDVYKIVIIIEAVIIVMVLLAGNLVFGKADPNSFRGQLDLGNQYLDDLNYEQAKTAFENALEIHPNNKKAISGYTEALYRIAEDLVDDGKYDDAKNFLQDEFNAWDDDHKYDQLRMNIDEMLTEITVYALDGENIHESDRNDRASETPSEDETASEEEIAKEITDAMLEAGEFTRQRFDDLSDDFVDKSHTRMLEYKNFGRDEEYYQVKYPGINTVADIKAMAGEYFTKEGVTDLFETSTIDWKEADGKLWASRPNSLYTFWPETASVCLEKINENQYHILLYFCFEEGKPEQFLACTENVTYRENGRWLFDDAWKTCSLFPENLGSVVLYSEGEIKQIEAAIREYVKVLESYREEGVFGLAYIDEDNIPELLVAPDQDFHFSAVKVYTYYNEKVSEVGEYGSYGSIMLKPRQNVIDSNYVGGGSVYDGYYSIKDGKEFLLGSFLGNIEGEEDTYHLYNDKEVGEKKFNELKSELLAQIGGDNFQYIAYDDLYPLLNMRMDELENHYFWYTIAY